MARGVDQVDDGVAVPELQRGAGDRDPAGLLDVHPVRHRRLAAGLAVDVARLVDHAGMQGEGLGERRLAGVGVADDREGATTGSLRDGGADGHAAPSSGVGSQAYGPTGRAPVA